MTGPELKAIRNTLGLSAAKFAALLQVADGSTIRKWEAGANIPGPVMVLARALSESAAVRRYFGLAVHQAQSVRS